MLLYNSMRALRTRALPRQLNQPLRSPSYGEITLKSGSSLHGAALIITK
jgi:hypothetical protein